VLFGVGLLAKEVTLVLPLLIVVHDYASRDEVVNARPQGGLLHKLRDSVWEVWPFMAIVIPYLALRIWVLRGFSHPVEKALAWLSIPFAWPELFWFYLHHLVWPVGLTIYYDLPSTVPLGLENFVLPLVGSAAVVLLLICAAAKSKVIRLSAAWFIIPLIPAFDLRVFSRDDIAHDRFLYLASIGFVLIVAHLIDKLPTGTTRLFGYSVTKVFLVLVLTGSMCFATTIESAYFRDDWHFLNHIWSAAPRNLYATLALGRYWRQRGQYAESAKLMENCVRDHPDDWDATYSLGRDYYKLGRFQEAIDPLIRASLLDPTAPGPYLDLGLTWMQLGEYDRAEAAFRETLKLKPDGYGYHFALGVALMKEGKQALALEQFEAELRLYPGNSEAKAQIGKITAGENRDGRRP
jgi:protein O-mannosyl-transferase